jgi:peptidyl-tRNA hydrolase, PTH2 family
MVKQVIVVNTNVPMSVGRLAAQGAHASIAIFLDKGKWKDDSTFEIEDLTPDMRYWMDESFTKVVLQVHGKNKLLGLAETAKNSNLPVSVIEDDGFTTAIAIGPCPNELVDPITRSLSLL